jgi:hypothetical protein
MILSERKGQTLHCLPFSNGFYIPLVSSRYDVVDRVLCARMDAKVGEKFKGQSSTFSDNSKIKNGVALDS